MGHKESKKSISRRSFISSVPGVAAALAAAAPAVISCAGPAKALTASEVHKYLNSLDGGWVDWDKTVDTFKSGGPQDEVKAIAVGWMSYTWALQKALEAGCNLFVTHEPTYYNHRDNDPEIFRFEVAGKKREFIEKTGITIIRCHDVWDKVPEMGITQAWGKLLELEGPLEGGGCYYVYDGKGQKAGAVARKIASKVAYMGQPGVQFIGPEDKAVYRIAIGCGAGTPMFQFIEELKADMAVCTDDGFTYWREGAFAIDSNYPVAIVNHPVSEEYGVQLLAEHLAQVFPQVPVHHIPQRCMYKVFNA
ncbi:MAG TPA: Nif3-like dinuclear metal center hexameric protein [archaeon]|nr:Nif3-like dinuclear metal center hexameric protein [archaeon]